MEYFVQQLINGLTLGSIYGLIAIGYTMVFGIIGMVNFAHGDVFMVSAFIALILYLLLTAVLGITALGIALLLVLVLGMALTALWSWVIERIAYRPLAGSFRLAPLISAIGMSVFLSNFVQVVQGPRNKPVPPLLNNVMSIPVGGGSVTLSEKQVLIMVVTVGAARRLLGRGAEDQARPRAACLRAGSAHGGAARRRRQPHVSMTFVIGGALAAVAGLMFMVYYGVVNFADGFTPGVKAFTAAVLGGIGSLPGAVLGGILIGLIETLWSAYFSIDYKDVAAFSILAIVLIFMPSGILGRPDVEKV